MICQDKSVVILMAIPGKVAVGLQGDAGGVLVRQRLPAFNPALEPFISVACKVIPGNDISPSRIRIFHEFQ